MRYLTILALALVASQPAHAYLDSSGPSVLVQALIGGFAGLAVLARLLLRRLRDRVTRRRPRGPIDLQRPEVLAPCDGSSIPLSTSPDVGFEATPPLS